MLKLENECFRPYLELMDNKILKSQLVSYVF